MPWTEKRDGIGRWQRRGWRDSFTWEGAPAGMESAELWCNALYDFTWEGAPDSLESVCMTRCWLTSFSWEGAPAGLKIVSLTHNRLTSFSWEGAPVDLEMVFLSYNRIKKFPWHGAPAGLTHLWLAGNRLTDFPWRDVPVKCNVNILDGNPNLPEWQHSRESWQKKIQEAKKAEMLSQLLDTPAFEHPPFPGGIRYLANVEAFSREAIAV